MTRLQTPFLATLAGLAAASAVTDQHVQSRVEDIMSTMVRPAIVADFSAGY